MYRFILGGSGSGKTNKALTDCISAAMAGESSHFLLIVPEQATTATEKELIRLHPNHATGSIDVLSFSRLAYMVFEELGIVNPDVLDDISKAMILRKTGAAHEDELKVWGRRFSSPGFVDNLKSMISELCLYGITPEDIKKNMPEQDRRLQNKMHDLALIYAAFKDAIRKRYVTPEEIPDILARNVHRSELIKDAYIVLDGFTGFTPVQYRIVESFLSCAREVVITVSIGDDRDSDLFDMSRGMINRIIDTASRNGIRHGQDIVLSTDSFLEKHLLRYDGIKGHVENDNVRLVHALNTAEESAFIINDIQRQVKTLGFRYRDIAVVCSDINRYKSILDHGMDLAGIPYYVDESIDICGNPLAAMLEAAFDIIHSDYSYESVMRYLKTGLASDDEEMTDIMDIYMYECGRRGYKRMSSPWDYMPDDLKDTDREALNAFRDSILAPLEDMRKLLSGDRQVPVSDIVKAASDLMQANDVGTKLERLKQSFESAGDTVHAREYSEVYARIRGLLENMESLLDGEKLSGTEFCEIFSAGAAQIRLGMIPSGTDRITIGDITRSRLDGIKILYVIGANDGSIPKVLSRGNVITDAEKEKLKSAGFELSPTVREDLLIQRYYLYRLLTKPSEKLIVTYAGLDLKGSELQPSYIIGHLAGLYDNLNIEEAEDSAELYDINAALRKTGEKLRDIRTDGIEQADEDFDSLYAYLARDEETRERIGLITSAALYSYRPVRLDGASIDLMYGDRLQGTISKLEKYAACPFSFFATYGLKLTEPEEFTFRALDIGNIAHAALEKVFSQAQKLRIDLTRADDESRAAMVHRCIEQAILDDESSKYSDTARNEYIVKRVERVVARSLWGLIMNMNDGFVPYKFEWGFGKEDGLSSSTYDLGGGKRMELSGIVDRTDILEREGEVAVRVIDYKSGRKTWDISDVVNGKDLQITLYMAAVAELLQSRFKGRRILPEEMFYYTLHDPIIDRDRLSKNKTVEDGLRDEMKFAGIKDRERIEELIPYIEGKAEGMGKMIAGGDISIRPSYKDQEHVSCSYCRYRAVCGFDRRIEGFGYNIEKKYDKDTAWQIINGQVNS